MLLALGWFIAGVFAFRAGLEKAKIAPYFWERRSRAFIDCAVADFLLAFAFFAGGALLVAKGLS